VKIRMDRIEELKIFFDGNALSIFFISWFSLSILCVLSFSLIAGSAFRERVHKYPINKKLPFFSLSITYISVFSCCIILILDIVRLGTTQFDSVLLLKLRSILIWFSIISLSSGYALRAFYIYWKTKMQKIFYKVQIKAANINNVKNSFWIKQKKFLSEYTIIKTWSIIMGILTFLFIFPIIFINSFNVISGILFFVILLAFLFWICYASINLRSVKDNWGFRFELRAFTFAAIIVFGLSLGFLILGILYNTILATFLTSFIFIFVCYFNIIVLQIHPCYLVYKNEETIRMDEIIETDQSDSNIYTVKELSKIPLLKDLLLSEPLNKYYILFEKFVRKEFCSENLYFYREIKNFEGVDNKKKYLDDIKDKYLGSDSVYEINISNQAKDKILSLRLEKDEQIQSLRDDGTEDINLDNWSTYSVDYGDYFAPAISEIYSCLQEIYTRFVSHIQVEKLWEEKGNKQKRFSRVINEMLA